MHSNRRGFFKYSGIAALAAAATRPEFDFLKNSAFAKSKPTLTIRSSWGLQDMHGSVWEDRSVQFFCQPFKGGSVKVRVEA